MAYRRVKLIENASLPLEARVELLLVYACQKPATDIFVYDFENLNEETETFELSNSRVCGILRLMRALNLAYVAGDKFAFEQDLDPDIEPHKDYSCSIETLPVYVSRTEEDAYALLAAEMAWDHREMGKLYGYPETAIQAYLEEREQFMGNLSARPCLGPFCTFTFSRDFFDEELESTSRRWLGTVNRLSPRLYQEIQGEYSKPH